MRSCLITYENRTNLDYYQAFGKLNHAYCQRHGFDYIQCSKYGPDIPDYWIKVWMIRDYLEFYDYVMWIDSDAVVRNFDFTMERYFQNKPWFMGVSLDSGIFSVEANAGVIVFRSCPQAKQFVDEWKSMYNPKRWRKVDGKWVCEGIFAGEDYEQGAMNKLIRTKWLKLVKVETHEVFCNMLLFRFSQAVHLCGNWKRYYPEIVNAIKHDFKI